MSATRFAIAGNLAMGLPNCWRDRAYSIEPSSRRSITPTLKAKEAGPLPVHRVREEGETGARPLRGPRSPAPGRPRARPRPGGEVRSPSFSILRETRTPGVVGVDEERRRAVRPLLGIGHGEEDEQVGDRRVRREHFRPVDPEAVAVGNGAGLHGERVGSGVGLGHGVRGDDLPAAQPRQVFLPLLARCRTSRSAPRRATGERRAQRPARSPRTRIPAPRAPSRSRADRARARRIARGWADPGGASPRTCASPRD